MSELSEARDKASALRMLMRQEGWEYFKAFVRENVEARRNQLLKPLGAADEVLEQEFVKGEIVGQESMILGLEAHLDELEAWIKRQERGLSDGEEGDEEGG